MLGVSWGSDWGGQAYADVSTVDQALDCLRCSLRRSLRHLSPQWRGCLLRAAARELQDRVDTQGREAVAAGKDWYESVGPVWASLHPK